MLIRIDYICNMDDDKLYGYLNKNFDKIKSLGIEIIKEDNNFGDEYHSEMEKNLYSEYFQMNIKLVIVTLQKMMMIGDKLSVMKVNGVVKMINI